MEINDLISSLKAGKEESLKVLYEKFRTLFFNWVKSTHNISEKKATEIYQFAVLSFYEEVLQNSSAYTRDNDVKVYLFSVAKNQLLKKGHDKELSYQAELEDEFFEGQTNKIERIEKIKKLVAAQGYPCKDLLRAYYFEGLSPKEIAKKIDYKKEESISSLKEKCVNRLIKLLNTSDDEL